MLMSVSLVRRNYGPQLYELMAAARKRLNQLRLIVTPRTTEVLISPNCVFDASLVPGTWLDCFVDSTGVMIQVPGESGCQ